MPEITKNRRNGAQEKKNEALQSDITREKQKSRCKIGSGIIDFRVYLLKAEFGNSPVAHEQTRQFMEQIYAAQLPEAEFTEYYQRLVSYFSLLAEIDQRNKPKADTSNDNTI